jgi:hypothetical protein
MAQSFDSVQGDTKRELNHAISRSGNFSFVECLILQSLYNPAATMAKDCEGLDTTVFMPHGRLEGLSEYFDCVPHYLFRVSSPRSSGTTTHSLIESAAAKFNLDRSDVLGRLFAAQHAIRRQATDQPASKPESINITILNTRKVPRGTFLPAVALLQAYNIESTGKLRHDYYHGEYLSQGRLYSDTIGTTTTLDNLTTYGLYELYPPFAEISQKTALCRRVLQLRETFMGIPKEPTNEEVAIAERISVCCFSHVDILPVVMMSLLSLEPRYRLEPRILKAFKDTFWSQWCSYFIHLYSNDY